MYCEKEALKITSLSFLRVLKETLLFAECLPYDRQFTNIILILQQPCEVLVFLLNGLRNRLEEVKCSIQDYTQSTH